MSGARWAEPFSFSYQQRTMLRTVLAGRQHADNFISAAEQIISIPLTTEKFRQEWTDPKERRKKAGAIASAAAALGEMLKDLPEDVADLLEMELWNVNRRRYEISVNHIHPIQVAAQDIAAAAAALAKYGPSKGRPALSSAEQLVQLLARSYEGHFNESPKPSTSNKDPFYRVMCICLDAANMRVTAHLPLMKRALAR